MFVTTVSMISLSAVSDPLIYCLIGPQWAEAASYLPLICMAMVLYPLHSINLNMLQIQGRSDIFFILEIIKKIIGVIPLLLGIFVNIYMMLWGGVVTGIIAFFLNSYYTGKKLNYSSWMQLRDISESFVLSFIIGIAVYFLKFIPVSYWIVLPLQILVGAITFFTICEKSRMEEYLELKTIVKNFIDKIR